MFFYSIGFAPGVNYATFTNPVDDTKVLYPDDSEDILQAIQNTDWSVTEPSQQVDINTE